MPPLLKFLCLLFLAALAPLCGAPTEPSVANAEPVTMPAFVVEAEQCGFERWTKSESRHYVVYTDMGANEAAEILAKLELLRAATCRLMGGEPLRSDRAIFVFPSRNSDWSKLEYIGREQWKPGASGISLSPVYVSVISEFSVIQDLFTSKDESTRFFGVIGLDLPASHGLPRQLWFDRGIGLLLRNVEIEGTTLTFGKKQQGDRTLRVHKTIPWNSFFKVTKASPEYLTKEGIRIYAAQCGLLIRWAFTHPNPEQRRKLEDWLYYLAAGNEPNEEALQRILGLNWEQFSMELDGYLKARKDSPFSYRINKDEYCADSRQLPLSVREIRELFLLVQVLSQHRAESRGVLEHILKKQSITPALAQLLVAACVRQGQKDKALDLILPLIAEGSDNPKLFEEAGRLWLTKNGKLDLRFRLGSSESEIRKYAERTLELEPRSVVAQSLQSICDAYGASQGAQQVDLIRARLNALGRHPSTREQRGFLAVALWRADELKEARSVCDGLLAQGPRKDLTEAMMTALRAELEKHD